MGEHSEGLDRRALLRRMAVGGAALWAAPSILSVGSVAAAASCGGGRLDWDTFATGALFTNTVVGTTTVSIAISGVNNTTLLSNNRRVLDGPAGGVYQKHLRFEMTPDNDSASNGSRQRVTFTFSNPVTDVRFSFFDIDNVNNAWGDRIVMNTPGYTWSRPFGSTVIGDGTDDNRFRSSNGNSNFANTSNAGNLNIRYAGTISAFSFTYRNQGEEGGQNQLISMSDLTFTC